MVRPDAVCACGHRRNQHTTIDFGGSTRGVVCCLTVPEEGIGDCPCMSPTYTEESI